MNTIACCVGTSRHGHSHQYSFALLSMCPGRKNYNNSPQQRLKVRVHSLVHRLPSALFKTLYVSKDSVCVCVLCKHDRFSLPTELIRERQKEVESILAEDAAKQEPMELKEGEGEGSGRGKEGKGRKGEEMEEGEIKGDAGSESGEISDSD